jgi:hypothetical protein
LPRSDSLVPPSDIRWLNRNKARVEFRLESVYYALPLTDPAYVGPLKRLEEGDYPSSALGIPEDGKILFTISLGEPFEGFCYKLVAAVVVTSVLSVRNQ